MHTSYFETVSQGRPAPAIRNSATDGHQHTLGEPRARSQRQDAVAFIQTELNNTIYCPTTSTPPDIVIVP